jgi:YfiH family protein
MTTTWIVPDWPAPQRVKALVTTRAGGVSSGPYASMNLGFSTGDEERAVAENRARLRAQLPGEPRWLKQVHGTRVVAADTLTDRPEADAAFACEPGTVCGILVADCLPVLFTDTEGTVVAAAHAGWRGLAGGVIDRAVDALRARSAHALLAYIGPGIGPAAFEVGDDVYEAFTATDAAAATAFVRHGPGKWLADLPALARRALARCGVEQVYGGAFCTYRDRERFFSYRRDRTTGRMAALIWRER